MQTFHQGNLLMSGPHSNTGNHTEVLLDPAMQCTIWLSCIGWSTETFSELHELQRIRPGVNGLRSWGGRGKALRTFSRTPIIAWARRCDTPARRTACHVAETSIESMVSGGSCFECWLKSVGGELPAAVCRYD